MIPYLTLEFLFLIPFLALAAYQPVGSLIWRRIKQGVSEWSRLSRSAESVKGKPTLRVLSSDPTGAASVKETGLYKDLYFKLQNLEKHSAILPQSRDLLISFLSEALTDAHIEPDSSILSMKSFEPKSLAKFLQSKDEETTLRWKQYVLRRKDGGPREMVSDHDHAKWWLKQIAPVKYVDGAWLGHIHRITTPFALRPITKIAWQVLSEELGDGDLSKNHVQVYRELMKEVESGLPDGDDLDFIHARHGLDKPHVWKAALSQLLISLFPHEFLPEILGFNMHYEMLTWDTMRAIKELRELKITDYYFLLHISIDNADSGHTAMAMQAVVDYMQHCTNANGEAAAQEAWRRVQAGFIFSESLATSPDTPYRESSFSSTYHNKHTAEVIKLFTAKASVAGGLHAGCKIRIKGRPLADWLDAHALGSKQRQREFLEALGNSRPWVRKGDSGASKLVQELSWNGKMFGSFTQAEVEVVKSWIDSLVTPTPDQTFYWSFVGRSEISSEWIFQNQNVFTDYPVLGAVEAGQPEPVSRAPPLQALNAPIKMISFPQLSRFLPLWFTHLCILESFITTPFKTTTASMSAILRVLRAQYGFAAEGSGVAGMDEVRRINSVDLLELGLEMVQRAGLPKPECLKDVLEGREDEFPAKMLHLAMRPTENRGLLLGLAWAFVELHDAVASSEPIMLLSPEGKKVLSVIAERERNGLQVCLDEVKEDEAQYVQFYKGFEMGRNEIERCF